jgi:hypothetical protein
MPKTKPFKTDIYIIENNIPIGMEYPKKLKIKFSKS